MTIELRRSTDGKAINQVLRNERGGIGMVIAKDESGLNTGGFLKPCRVTRQYPSPEEVRAILTGGDFDPSNNRYRGLVAESHDIQNEKRRKRKRHIPNDMKTGI